MNADERKSEMLSCLLICVSSAFICGFHCFDFSQAAAVSFFTSEACRYKRANDLEGEFYSNYARSQTKYIAIVVFA